jgi:transketolase
MMTRTLNPRQAYGEALVALGAENQAVVALDADLSKSTMSTHFEQAYPDRFFEMGIAEQNMLSTAAGLAASGKIPYCSTFSVFAAGRAYDQIRQTIAIGRLNVKICGSSAGLSDFGDGSTHQSVEDLALMSAIPGMTVLTPCDAEETRQAVRAAASIDGPVFIRVVRNDLPALVPEDAAFTGAPRVLREGEDALLLAHGCMTARALEAAALLHGEGIGAKVVNVPMLKPFPYAAIADMASKARCVVTAEDHSFIGGLASAVALALRRSATPMAYVAIEDRFGQSAHRLEELMEHYGLTAGHIVRNVLELLNG